MLVVHDYVAPTAAYSQSNILFIKCHWLSITNETSIHYVVTYADSVLKYSLYGTFLGPRLFIKHVYCIHMQSCTPLHTSHYVLYTVSTNY